MNSWKGGWGNARELGQMEKCMVPSHCLHMFAARNRWHTTAHSSQTSASTAGEITPGEVDCVTSSAAAALMQSCMRRHEYMCVFVD